MGVSVMHRACVRGLLRWLALLPLLPGCALLVDAVDLAANRTRDGAPPPRREAAALHRRLEVVDLHADTLLWNRGLLEPATRGHVDLDRLERGNVAVQVFAAVTAVPLVWRRSGNADRLDVIPLLAGFSGWRQRDGWPREAHGAALPERMQFALVQAGTLKSWVAQSEGRLKLILSRGDLREVLAARSRGGRQIGVLLAVEGAHLLGTGLEEEQYVAHLRILFEAGFRMLGLAHAFDNDMAGSAQGRAKHGLTPAGRAVLRRALEWGMILDLSHASEETIADVLALAAPSGTPVIASHGGVKETCDSARNLGPAQVGAIARANGLIGVGLFADATCGETLDASVQAMRAILRQVGPEHVALGSDFDGFVATPIHAGQLNRLTEALQNALCDCTTNADCLTAAVCRETIAKIMGRNALRVMEAVLP